MSGFLPTVTFDDDNVQVRLDISPSVRSVAVECVLDMTDFRDLIGIEILDLTRQTGGCTVDPSPQHDRIWWGYDDEIDAYYIRLLEGSAPHQKVATAIISLDSHDRIVRIDTRVPPLA